MPVAGSRSPAYLQLLSRSAAKWGFPQPRPGVEPFAKTAHGTQEKSLLTTADLV